MCPGTHQRLLVFLVLEEAPIQELHHLRNRKSTDFFMCSPQRKTQVQTILVDICCPASGSDSSPSHLSQQTVAPHVLSPVFVLAFSSSFCTNDTVQRSHRMSLDPHPRLPVYLSLRHCCCREAPLPMQVPQGIFQMSVYLTVEAMRWLWTGARAQRLSVEHARNSRD